MGVATGPAYKVRFRRRRKSLTNYAKRLGLVKSAKPRMVVRKSSRYVLVQFVKFFENGDRTVCSASSKELEKFGGVAGKNLPCAYLTGMLCGKKALKAGVSEFVLDIGLGTPTKGSFAFAAMKGAVDAGLKTNFAKEIISEERISGKHIQGYAEKLRGEGNRFSRYAKAGMGASEIVERFAKAKSAIASG